MDAIKAVNLTKKYKDLKAVDGIDLTVREGECLALLGVNGAGKTTTIRILTCLSTPTAGEAQVFGHSVTREKEAVKRLVGISPQDTAVTDHLTVEENLRFMAGLYLDKNEIGSRIEQMIEWFHLDEVRNQRAKTLSGGWKRKLSIAMAMIGEPKVLFLDEPTLGLDVLARRELWKEIEALKSGITIVLTTHYMEEAESLADRIAVMMNGKIKAMGTLSELEKATGEKGLENVFVRIAESNRTENNAAAGTMEIGGHEK